MRENALQETKHIQDCLSAHCFWLAAFMLTGPSAKITNLGALKIVLGISWDTLFLLDLFSECRQGSNSLIRYRADPLA